MSLQYKKIEKIVKGFANHRRIQILELLDKYLGLDVDYKPLLQRAGEMEDKIKELLTQAKEATEMQRQKGGDTTPYIG